MGNSRRLVSMRTYAVAFVVVLSSVFLQVGCPRGNTELTSLELEVDGGPNLITGFDTGVRSYDVSTSGSTVTVRAQAVYGINTVSWQWLVGTTTIDSGPIGTGGGEVTLPVPIPHGQSVLRVVVKSNEVGATASGYYAINIDRIPGYPCTEQGILDAIADGGGPHYFDCQGPTVVTTTSILRFDKGGNVILDGEGNLTVDANGSHGLAYVSPIDTVELRRMTLTGGTVVAGTGGGIRSAGTLTLVDAVVSGNSAITGAGLYNTGAMTLRSTIVSGNTGTHALGGGGGIFQSYGTLTVIDSRISGNSAGSGGGIDVSGGEATIVGSSVLGNAAATRYGGGVDIHGAEVTIVNSTVSGNSAVLRGDGIHNASGTNPASLTLISTTVFGNAGSGRGSALFGNGVQATFELVNSIIEGDCVNLGNPPLAQHTIESPGDTCGLPTGQGNQVGVGAAELDLGPLQDNGGNTLTQAPLSAGVSVAIDLIPEAACLDHNGAPLLSDQRGFVRPQNLLCDVGAVEGTCDACNDGDECTADACDPITLACSNPAKADGTPCASGVGECIAGVCTDAREWGAAVLIENDDGAVSDAPHVAMDGAGNAVAVWKQSDGTYFHIWSNRFSPGSGWAGAALVQSDDAFTEDPQVAVADYGDAVAVWAQHNGTTGYDIWSNRSTRTGGWESPEIIGGPVGFGPKVAVDPAGRAVAVWRQPDGGYQSIWANRLSTSGDWAVAEVIESTTGAAAVPEVAMDLEGNAIAVWMQLDSAAYNIWANRLPFWTGWGTAEKIESDETHGATVPYIAMDAKGNALALWQQTGTIGSNYFDEPSESWGTATLSEVNDGSSAAAPRIAMDAHGNAVAVWRQPGGSVYDIWANQLTPSGGWGTPERIETNGGEPANPELAMDLRGNAVAVWAQDNGTTGYDIWSNRFSPAFGWGTAERIETSDGGAAEPQVAMDAQGHALVVWRQSDGARFNIWSNQLR
jgi:hypothetical protein